MLFGSNCSALLANIELEAAVVGVVCAVFLVLFVVAGIRQIVKLKDQDH
ncbi:MAG: hypothetical protein KDK78_02900 [Chlamydiia bacterium]|nr:hypothetical protein [Chlamydiia bacterium]